MSALTCGELEYGIGLTPNKIVPLRLLGVPPPDQVVCQAAAMYYQRADFARVGDGFASVQWIYDVISMASLFKVLEFLAGATYKSLYVQTDWRDGTFPNVSEAFKVYSATLWKPILSGEEGVFVARSSKTIQTVKLTFMNTIEQAGYL